MSEIEDLKKLLKEVAKEYEDAHFAVIGLAGRSGMQAAIDKFKELQDRVKEATK